MSIIKKAQRREAYLKIGMSSVSGGGKTYGALRFAKGFMLGDMSKVVVLDTENGSANLYDSLGEYSVLPFAPPFHPQRYASAIDLVEKEGYQFLIIDSSSHEWDGEGGALDIHSKIPGNSYVAWNTVTPMHKKFIDAVLQSKLHVICTMRRKQDYELVDVNGKKVPQKVGLKEIQRDGFEYDLTLNFDIDIKHMATASKDRTGLFKDNIPFMITEETGKLVRDWNMGVKKDGL